MNIKLNQATIEAIKEKKELRLKIQAALGITHNTMKLAIATNDIRLTTLDSLAVITEHLNKPLSELLENKVSKLLMH